MTCNFRAGGGEVNVALAIGVFGLVLVGVSALMFAFPDFFNSDAAQYNCARECFSAEVSGVICAVFGVGAIGGAYKMHTDSSC